MIAKTSNISTTIRINKFLSSVGFCSRRKAEQLIMQNRVLVDGKPATIGMSIDTHLNQITVDGKLLSNVINYDNSRPSKLKIWRYYKPVGIVCSHNDQQGRRTIVQELKSKLPHPHFITVGRLDINSQGLLLITNNGDWAQKMMRSNLLRIYKVRVYGKITNTKLQKMIKELQQGINIKGIQYQEIILKKIENHEPTPATPNDCSEKKGSNYWFEVTLCEGKNREIRRVFNYFNLQVNRLIRTNYGDFDLADLQPGDIRPCKTKNIL